MKLTKNLLALVLAFAMVGSLASVFAFAEFGYSASGEPVKVADNVYHTSYKVTSGENGNVVDAQVLTFSPSDGYLPLVYAANAGWASTLKTQYERASIERWGYEPVAVINGSFFSMVSGTDADPLVGIAITDGRIISAHSGYSGEMVTFDNTGKMKVVNSCIDYKLFVNGKELPNSLYYFNKVTGPDSTVSDRIYYYDSACGTVCDSAEYGSMGVTGVEVVCNKVDNSELSVGGTLVGEVVSVIKESEGGAAIGTNQFVLYCRNESSFKDALASLKAGNTVKIAVTETIAASKETMENCFTAITNVGWLVKDGVDQTHKVSTIGTHSVTLDRGWTAFGTKPDGSFVFYTSTDGSAGSGKCVTLRDVAKLLMELGCTNVIRMDGGGSSAMYLGNTGNGEPGYAQYSSRGVSDCILVVKKSSVAPPAELKTAFDAAIKKAEDIYKTEPSATIKTAIDAAKAIRNNANSTEGDYKSGIMTIATALSGKQELKAAVTKAEAIKRTDYCQYVLDNLDASLKAAKKVLNDSKATDEDYAVAYADLSYWYNLTGSQLFNVAYGKDYTTSATPNASYPDTGNSELTDGKDGNGSEGFSPTWVGFNGKNTYDVIVDFGANTTNMTKFSVNALQIESWGIQLPKEVVVSVSNDKTNWTKVGTMKPADGILGAKNKDGGYTLETTLNSGVSGRYVKFTLTPYTTFIFIGEVSAFAKYDTVTEVVTPPNTDTSEPETSVPETSVPEVDVTDIPEDATVLQQVPFNTVITAGSTTIVTDITVLNDLNPIWAANALLRPTDKEGVYEVVEVIEGSGTAIEFTSEIKEGDIVLVVHGDDQSEDTTSMENRAALLALTADDVVTVLGYSIENEVMAENAVIYYGAKTDDETSEIPDESETDTSVPEESEEKDESSKADESVADTSEGEDNKGGNTGLIIGIIVAVVAIAAVVAVVVLKKKKA